MIPVNLLPHRAQRRAALQKQFIVTALGTAAVGLGIVVMVRGFFARRIDSQNGRNKFLTDEIAALDKQIDEIKILKEQTASLMARKQVVEQLQANRTEAVRLLDQLVRQLPEGLYLKAIKQNDSVVSVQGFANSNARASTLMRNLEASPWLESPSLVEMVHQTFVWVICQCRSRALLPSPTGRGTEVREKRLRIHVSSLTPTPLPEGEGLSCIDAPTQKSEGP
ncbi:MAG: PilN domain-containing protein [Betaproteobacteria bacterium]|nr:PilN domain-containing protein [Betaproteobacteria bacterium]